MPFCIELEKRNFVKFELSPAREHDLSGFGYRHKHSKLTKNQSKTRVRKREFKKLMLGAIWDSETPPQSKKKLSKNDLEKKDKQKRSKNPPT